MSEVEENEAYKKDSNFVSESAKADKINVDAEAERIANEIGFDAKRLTNALIEIGQKMLGVELYEYQIAPAKRIIYSLLINDGSELTLLFSRQSGKTEIITFVAVIVGVLFPVLAKVFKQLDYYKHGAKMGAFAPQLDQVETLYGRCLERIWNDNTRQFLSDPDIGDYPLSKVNFKLRSGSFLKAQSGAKQSKIESKTYHVCFIDESQDMDTEKVRKSIMPMLASTYGTVVRLGTPNRNKGDFYYTIKNNKAHDKKLKRSDYDWKRLHFEYDYKEVIRVRNAKKKKDGKIYHGLYEKAVLRDMKSMGRHSESFRMSYCLEWLLDVGMFITEENLSEFMFDNRAGFPEITPKDFVVAGLDIASARNSTVLTLGIVDYPAEDIDDRPSKTVAGWVELSGLDYEKQFEIISDELIKNNVKVLYADYTGVGRAFLDRLIYHLGERVEIIPYTFNPASKSDMWKRLDEDITNRRIKVPTHRMVRETREFENFQEQMLNLQKMWKGSYMVCEKISGYMDDYPDSLGLMNLAGNHFYFPQPEVEVTEGNFIFAHNSRSDLINNSRW